MKKIFPLFAVIIVLVLAVCSFHIIPTGYTGVKTSFGQIQETTIQSGKLNFCIPFVQSIHKVNNKQQDKHIEAQVWGEASDKTPVYAADVIVTYQVLPEKSAWLYANVSDIKNLVGDELVASAIKSSLRQVPLCLACTASSSAVTSIKTCASWKRAWVRTMRTIPTSTCSVWKCSRIWHG